jgi:cephalosporin hydroxylase
MTDFEKRNEQMIAEMARDPDLRQDTQRWFERASKYEYSYHFTWLGRPIIQFPQDVIALQEIVWAVRPSLIVETGVARGGSLIFYASLLHLLGGEGRVVGIDVDIRAENRAEIEKHPLAHRIILIQGSSVAPATVAQVVDLAQSRRPVLVVLDSLHTHEHVRRELELYSPLVSAGSYLVVLDTIVEHMPPEFSANRPWGPGDNPQTAVRAFLQTTDRFVVDQVIEDKLQITVGPGGYLRCVRD